MMTRPAVDGTRIERIAFDIGGTFTDVVVLRSDGRLETAKLLSLLDSVGSDIRRALRLDGAAIEGYVHGTTVAANALLEGKLSRIGLLTTDGFRDVLEMRSQRRPNVYDVNWERSKPLVPRELRLGLAERIRADGSVETPLDEKEAGAAVDRLVAAGIDAVAVCLVNAYANPAHERRLGEIVRERARHIPLCLSSEEFSEIREYERTSTTAVNAALMPIVDAYLRRLEEQLGVEDARLQIMQSNGGLMNARIARRRPVQMVESGPAAGVLAAARLAGELGLAQALAFDMGGTTAKASLIENGTPVERPGGEVGGGANLAARFFGGSGHAIRVPAFDIAEVGAGGGSIAWIDRGGALRVGPEGAGARPGPVCYRRGGERATVTDANVVLGYMNPASLAGSTVAIDRDAAAEAIRLQVAEPLGLSLLEAAHGIVEVANATTMRALRTVSIERGVDPRNVSMVAFGGSGPVHAAALAGALGVPRVYVPPFPGIFSAIGLLLADFRHDAVRSVVVPLEKLDEATVIAQYAELERSVRAVMERQGIEADRIELHAEIDVQYRRHDMPLTLPLPRGEGNLAALIGEAFQAAHVAAFGYRREDPAEVVSLRLRGTARAGEERLSQLAAAATPISTRGVSAGRQAYFGARLGMLAVTVLNRAALCPEPCQGPLIVEEWDTSVVVPPGWSACRDEAGNVVLADAGRAP